MQRIRYRKDGHKLITVSELIARNGARYMVFIDLEEKTYVIRNVVSMRKWEGGQGINNLNVLKRKVKKHLQNLGVNFSKESRQRTFGVCDKGYTQSEHLKRIKENQ